jgi:hypothetical protein
MWFDSRGALVQAPVFVPASTAGGAGGAAGAGRQTVEGSSVDPVSWIVDDCLGRAHKIHDRIFIANFPNNKVPYHLKIAYKRASKRKYCYDAEPPPLQENIDNHLLSLPPNTLAIFTDGSAIGNPGPTGAGVVFFNSTHPTSPIFSANASLGNASNNGGELFAIGLGIKIADKADYVGPIHLYTDSKVIKAALTKGESATLH